MRDVVITGRGIISPAGRGVEAAWNGVLAAESAAAVDDRLVEAGTPVTLACRVPDFDPDAEFGRGTTRRMDRYTHLALAAAADALLDAGLVDGAAFGDGLLASVDRDRVGILLGSGIGGAETWAAEYPNYLERGPGRVSPMFIPKMLSNTAAGVVSMRSGARGPNMTVNTACAAGASAIHIARDLIRHRPGRRGHGRRSRGRDHRPGGLGIRADGRPDQERRSRPRRRVPSTSTATGSSWGRAPPS